MTPATASEDRRHEDRSQEPRRLVVLYDGLCGMCDAVVQFLLRHDKRDSFRFAAQQGETAQQVFARHKLDPRSIETICVIENLETPEERVYTKSEAAMRIAEGMGGVWEIARIGQLLPRAFRDAGYDLIARNRYRIFGRRTECRVPAPGDQSKFLS